MDALEISPTETKQLLDQSEIVLIDCREPEEFEVAKIEGAVLLPTSQWPEVHKRLDEFEGSRIVVHCHHGMRSMQVVHWMRQNGFPDAQSMQGGIAAWSQEIDSSIPQY